MVLMHPYLNASFNPEVSLLEEDLPDITKHSMGIELMDYGSAIEDVLSLKGMYEFLPMQLGDVEKNTGRFKKSQKILLDFHLKQILKLALISL